MDAIQDCKRGSVNGTALAIYVPCAGHSPNSVGVKAEWCCLEIVKFIDFVQRLYSFFSASTHRCSVLKSVLGNYHQGPQFFPPRNSPRNPSFFRGMPRNLTFFILTTI